MVDQPLFEFGSLFVIFDVEIDIRVHFVWRGRRHADGAHDAHDAHAHIYRPEMAFLDATVDDGLDDIEVLRHGLLNLRKHFGALG